MGANTRDEQDRVRNLLLDTVTLLCKNGLSFKKQLKVQGLLGITLDEDDVFIVHINEKVGELVVEHQKKDKEIEESDQSSRDSTPAKVNRKRTSNSSPMFRGPPDKTKRIKVEKEEPDADLILVEEQDDKTSLHKMLQQQQQPGLHPITNIQPSAPGVYRQQHFSQNNLQGGPYMSGVVNNPQQQHNLMGQTMQGATPDKRISAVLGLNRPAKHFKCEYPDCSAAFVHKRNLRQHEIYKHNRTPGAKKACSTGQESLSGRFLLHSGAGQLIGHCTEATRDSELLGQKPESNDEAVHHAAIADILKKPEKNDLHFIDH